MSVSACRSECVYHCSKIWHKIWLTWNEYLVQINTRIAWSDVGISSVFFRYRMGVSEEMTPRLQTPGNIGSESSPAHTVSTPPARKGSSRDMCAPTQAKNPLPAHSVRTAQHRTVFSRITFESILGKSPLSVPSVLTALLKVLTWNGTCWLTIEPSNTFVPTAASVMVIFTPSGNTSFPTLMLMCEASLLLDNVLPQYVCFHIGYIAVRRNWTTGCSIKTDFF